MTDEKDAPKKKGDLTELIQLPPDAAGPSSEDTPVPIEEVDNFESIDQMGMMDHVSESPAPAEDPFVSPFLVDDAPTLEPIAEPALELTLEPDAVMDQLQSYSDQTRGTTQDLPVAYPFHLLISGEFGPFERDKLFLFITENPIGLTSADLDLQINGGRVLFPRISEFAGIKMIQELRDSGLHFSLIPSDRDADETVNSDEPKSYHYDGRTGAAAPASVPLPVLQWSEALAKEYEEIDTIQVTQFFKAEMVEVEQSELFQEVVDRMMNALKQKARLKGGSAITRVEQKLLRLRLPSQYQVSIEAGVLRKRST